VMPRREIKKTASDGILMDALSARQR